MKTSPPFNLLHVITNRHDVFLIRFFLSNFACHGMPNKDTEMQNTSKRQGWEDLIAAHSFK